MSPTPFSDSPVETPTFHEDWYSDRQLTLPVRLCRYARDLPGAFMEIGCWEGKSTIALANACYPEVLIAVDSWLGNLTEPDHPTVEILGSRDVYQTFIDNVGRLTQRNVEVHRADCFDFLSTFDQPVKFCHIDAAHDFASVRRTLEHLKPCLRVNIFHIFRTLKSTNRIRRRLFRTPFAHPGPLSARRAGRDSLWR